MIVQPIVSANFIPYLSINIDFNAAIDLFCCSQLVWSLGITAIELADGRPPYSDIHPMRAMFMIPTKEPATVRYPAMFSDQFNSFVGRCLVKDPELRETSSDLLQNDGFISNAKAGTILCDIIELAIKERNKLKPSDLMIEGKTADSQNPKKSRHLNLI